MTKNEFQNTILPFLDYYWTKTHYYDMLNGMWGRPIRIGNMVLFCTKSYIPDNIIIVDADDNIVDGYHICHDNMWNGELIRDKLLSLGMWQQEEEQ